MEKRPNRFDRLRDQNPREWDFWMNHVCQDVDGNWYGWGRVLDYIGVEWKNAPGQVLGQISMETLMDEWGESGDLSRVFGKQN